MEEMCECVDGAQVHKEGSSLSREPRLYSEANSTD